MVYGYSHNCVLNVTIFVRSSSESLHIGTLPRHIMFSSKLLHDCCDFGKIIIRPIAKERV